MKAAAPQATVLPACLTRTAADDRAEARAFMDSPEYDGCNNDEALAAIQRREAEAVLSVSQEYQGPRVKTLPTGGSVALPSSLLETTRKAAVAAKWACAPTKYDDEVKLTLAQRATLLDAARALVQLALEVSA